MSLYRSLLKAVLPGKYRVAACLLVLQAACATKVPDGETVVHVQPDGPNKAIAMAIPHDMQRPFSVYGIELGETRAEVAGDYQLIGCRKEYDQTRCSVILDTRGVPGVSVSDSTMLFVSFDDGELERVISVSLVIFPGDIKPVMEKLQVIYHGPGETMESTMKWSNETGDIELDTHNRNDSPAGLRYTAR